MPTSLVPASEIDFAVFLDTFNAAYRDYFVLLQMELEPMRQLIQRDAVDLAASRVALAGGRPVGVGMLAIREQQGWIGGLGIVPSHRGQGIGRQLTLALLDAARQRGLGQVQLEVIDKNTTARGLYESLNFQETRRLFLLERPPDASDGSRDPSISITKVHPDAALQHYNAFHSSPNPWQRRQETLTTLADHMAAWIATRDDETLAYAVGWATPDVIRFMDCAMQPDAAPAMQDLLNHVHSSAANATASIMNVGEDDPVLEVLRSVGYQQTGMQLEMHLNLD
jgi:ribosomal protein S18 acetylase RimI-like enzyme